MKRISTDRLLENFLDEHNIPYRVYCHMDRYSWKYNCTEYAITLYPNAEKKVAEYLRYLRNTDYYDDLEDKNRSTFVD